MRSGKLLWVVALVGFGFVASAGAQEAALEPEADAEVVIEEPVDLAEEASAQDAEEAPLLADDAEVGEAIESDAAAEPDAEIADDATESDPFAVDEYSDEFADDFADEELADEELEEVAFDPDAEESPAAEESLDEVAFDQASEAPAEFAPATSEMAVPAAAMADQTDRGHQVLLGPVGKDAEGREGRVHVVVPGDTLWDISSAYLGTPWVWPSLWTANDDIKNPHVIHPGDRIWITSDEMRRVTAAEADAYLANANEPEFAPEPADAQPEPHSGAAVSRRRASGRMGGLGGGREERVPPPS